MKMRGESNVHAQLLSKLLVSVDNGALIVLSLLFSGDKDRLKDFRSLSETFHP